MLEGETAGGHGKTLSGKRMMERDWLGLCLPKVITHAPAIYTKIESVSWAKPSVALWLSSWPFTPQYHFFAKKGQVQDIRITSPENQLPK